MTRRIAKCLAASLAASLAGGPFAAAAQEPAPDDLETRAIAPAPVRDSLSAVEEYLRSIDTLKADFVQQSPDGSVATGVLSLDRPGRLRFEYTDETPLLLVSDGDVLTFVDYSVGQVTRWPIEDTALGLLVADRIDLDDSDAVVGAGPAEENIVSVTAKDPDRPEQGHLTLFFEHGATLDEDMALLGWEVVDGQGYLTRIRLTDTRTNVALDSGLWEFKDPRKLPSQRRKRRR